MGPVAFSAGDPTPAFVAISENNPQFHFDSVAGRYIVLSFFISAALPASAAALAFIESTLATAFDDEHAAFFGVGIDLNDRARLKNRLPGIHYLWDPGSRISEGLGAASRDKPPHYEPFTLVLDPALRVIEYIPLADANQHNARLQWTLQTLPPVDHHAGPSTELHAPVLIVPRIFEPEFCRTLIDLYEAKGGSDSGFMRNIDGRTVGILDHGFKRRKDMTIEDEAIKAGIRARISRRLAPEIRKAFQFNATHIERYIVACYDGKDAGFFRPHRDNTTPGTAHRAFACTINLNADDYTGGDLRFPEFGSRTYRAPSGGAVVFSCSLLHEATPVTSGRRYATLPFLYDAARARLREKNQSSLSGTIIDLNQSNASTSGEPSSSAVPAD